MSDGLMASVPAEHADLFMRAVQSIPSRAFGRGVGTRSFGFFQNLAERPRSMHFLIDAGYDLTFHGIFFVDTESGLATPFILVERDKPAITKFLDPFEGAWKR